MQQANCYNPLMEHARLFLALDLDHAVRERLLHAGRAVRDVLPRARWCRDDALHLTLWFFGTMPLAAVAEIGAALAPVAAATAAFSCTVRGLGGFPSLERPRVLWAGVGDGADAVSALAARVRDALTARGFAGEDRAFVPHITLARITARAPVDAAALERAMPGAATRAFGSSDIDRLVLYASELRPAGPVYTVVDTWPLAGTAST